MGEGNPEPAYGSDPIVAQLARVISRVGPAGRLPSERELALELGVSRTALRDRLQQVEAMGVLRRTVGSGTYVQPVDPSGLAVGLQIAVASSHLSLDNLVSVRVALERQAAVEAARLADPVLIAYIQKAAREIASARDDDEVAAADARFHTALLRAADNPAISFFADALSGPLHASVSRRIERLKHVVDNRQLMTNAHNAIHAAVASGDPAAAARAVDDHYAAFESAIAGKSQSG